jgi:hypothetical protein
MGLTRIQTEMLTQGRFSHRNDGRFAQEDWREIAGLHGSRRAVWQARGDWGDAFVPGFEGRWLL